MPFLIRESLKSFYVKSSLINTKNFIEILPKDNSYLITVSNAETEFTIKRVKDKYTLKSSFKLNLKYVWLTSYILHNSDGNKFLNIIFSYNVLK